jgi:L-lactate dehydrogenase complex protein LldG
MSSSRTAMLNRIRAAVAAGASDVPAEPIPRGYQRVGTHPAGSDHVLELLVDRLVDYKAKVTVVDADGDLETAVDAALDGSRSVVVPAALDPITRAGCAARDRTVVVDGEPSALTPVQLDAIDAVVTGATVAIAVTGTIILSGRPDEGRRAISLVPDLLVVVLPLARIVETVPDGLRLLSPTAPLTMISGPSATSDIELSRVEGVHGPRTLHVVIVR